MKTRLLALLVALVTATPSFAQLATPNAAGAAIGHIHINATDVDAQSRFWTTVGGQIVQPPGPSNALGRIKLMFPNSHHVYLHDTPSRNLFASEARPFSSGCIRVEDVVDLAVLAIDDSVKWSKEKLNAAIATGRTQNVSLARRIPVLVTYWTAIAGPGNEGARFYEDVYERDPAMLAALDRPFRFRPAVASRAAVMSAK